MTTLRERLAGIYRAFKPQALRQADRSHRQLPLERKACAICGQLVGHYANGKPHARHTHKLMAE